jgi:integrase/recombinase XerD
MSDNPVKKTRNRRRLITNARLYFALPYFDPFVRWLEARKYTKGTIAGLITQFGHWTQWMHKAGFGIATVRDGYSASVPALKNKPYSHLRLRAGALFILFLEGEGLVDCEPTPPSPPEIWPIIADFRGWMRGHRGALDSSLDTYQVILVDLMLSLGDEPQTYTAHAIREFVLKRATKHGHASARMTVTVMRSFLRFLIAVGKCPAGRDHAIPNVAGWRFAPVPQFLSESEIERLIAACEGEKRLRDRAVILLLTRLGLRGGEVANLEFGHIDWANGRIAIVGGKSRRAEWLPMPQEIGEALIAYLKMARPRLATPCVFVTTQNPIRPLTRFAVNRLVQAALDRAGIQSARRGSHILRHSAATAMLRHGATLAGVGAVLRHRSPSMTMQYAKVDFDVLREIAQPWAGRSVC